jgi:hypothetical protein
MVKGLLTVSLLASLFLASSASWADGAGDDEVTLKNGGTIRGTVVSSEPGVRVKILESGAKDARVIPWAQVADVERGKFAASSKADVQPGSAGSGYSSPPPSTKAQKQAPAPSADDAGVVRLHVDTPNPVRVYERASATGTVNGYAVTATVDAPVCVSPCDKVLDGSDGSTFYVRGDSVPTSNEFSFAGMKGDADLHVKPGSSGLRTGGWVLTGLGIAATAVGATGMLIGYAGTPYSTTLNTDGSVSTTKTFSGDARTPSIIIAAAGGVAIVGGIIMILNGRTHIQLEPEADKTGAIKPRYWLGEF